MAAGLSGAAVGLTGCASAPAPAGATGDWVTESDESPERKRARLRLELASAYFAQGLPAVALDEVKQALASDPAYAPAWNLRGLVYLQLAQWPLAEDSLARALALAPDDADAAHNFGWLLCQHPEPARHAEAAAWFRRALAQPGYAHALRSWTALGLCQQQLGALDEAEASLRQALQLAPGHAGLMLRLAQLQHQRGQWQPAGELLAQLHARGAASADSLWLAARVARRLDNPALVQQLGERLRQEFGRTPQARAFEQGLFDE